MKYPIANPFIDTKGYNCFACAPHNSIGLHLTFEREDSCVRARWTPTPAYQGYSGIVHGGIQATILDEVGSWAIFTLCGVAAVTQNISVEYRRALPLGGDAIVATAVIATQDRRTICVDADLSVNDTLYTHARTNFRILPSKMAADSFGFPNPEHFHIHK